MQNNSETHCQAVKYCARQWVSVKLSNYHICIVGVKQSTVTYKHQPIRQANKYVITISDEHIGCKNHKCQGNLTMIKWETIIKLEAGK